MTYYAFSLSDILRFDEAVANNMTMSEKLQNIAVTALGGFLLVFAVLTLIFLLLKVFSLFCTQKKTEEKPIEAEEIIAHEPVMIPVVEPESDDGELIAAITAAITAFRSESGEKTTGFRVVSFRKR
jgi:sodium pump decarboxylase gamma subunit